MTLISSIRGRSAGSTWEGRASVVSRVGASEATSRPASGESPSRLVAPRRSLVPTMDWRRRYTRRLWITDLLALIWSVYGTQLLWFGWGNAQVAMREDTRITELSYWVFSGVAVSSGRCNTLM